MLYSLAEYLTQFHSGFNVFSIFDLTRHFGCFDCINYRPGSRTIHDSLSE